MTLMLSQHSNLTQNQPLSWKSWSHRQLNRRRGEIHTSPQARLDDAGDEIPGQSTHPHILPVVDMDCCLRVTFSKDLRYAPTSTGLIRCRRHGDGTLQPKSLPKVFSNMPYPSSLKGTHRGVHRHYQCKNLTSTALWAAAYREDPRTRHINKIVIQSPTARHLCETPRCPSTTVGSSTCQQ